MDTGQVLNQDEKEKLKRLRHQVRELEMEKHTLERLQPTSRKK
jgi:hypothetical protein